MKIGLALTGRFSAAATHFTELHKFQRSFIQMERGLRAFGKFDWGLLIKSWGRFLKPLFCWQPPVTQTKKCISFRFLVFFSAPARRTNALNNSASHLTIRDLATQIAPHRTTLKQLITQRRSTLFTDSYQHNDSFIHLSNGFDLLILIPWAWFHVFPRLNTW